MKKIFNRRCILSVLLCIASFPVYSQDARILLKFEDAEKSFNKGAYKDALRLLDEVEAQSGVTSKTLYLRVVAEYGIFDKGGRLYEDATGFDRLQSVRGHAATYLKSLSDQGIDEKYRTVYQISKGLDSFPATRREWQQRYDAIAQQRAESQQIADNCIFDIVQIFKEGVCSVSLNGKWGVIDPKGEVVVPFRYEMLEMSNEGLMAARENGKWGFIDRRGNWVIPARYDLVRGFSEGLAPVMKTGEKTVAYIDKTGKTVFTIKAKSAQSFQDGLAIFESDRGQFGFINTKGEVVIKARYGADAVVGGFDGLVRVEGHDFYNRDGKRVLSLEQYDQVSVFCNGLASVVKGNKVGFVDKAGKLVIPLLFDGVNFPAFNEQGLACVQIGNKWGYIDRNGRVVIEPEFPYAINFYDGLAQVATIDTARNQGLVHYIDPTGKTVLDLPASVQKAWYFSQGLAALKINDKWGFIDKKGQIVTIKMTRK